MRYACAIPVFLVLAVMDILLVPCTILLVPLTNHDWPFSVAFLKRVW